jgi:hypothetical protein
VPAKVTKSPLIIFCREAEAREHSGQKEKNEQDCGELEYNKLHIPAQPDREGFPVGTVLADFR